MDAKTLKKEIEKEFPSFAFGIRGDFVKLNYFAYTKSQNQGLFFCIFGNKLIIQSDSKTLREDIEEIPADKLIKHIKNAIINFLKDEFETAKQNMDETISMLEKKESSKDEVGTFLTLSKINHLPDTVSGLKAFLKENKDSIGQYDVALSILNKVDQRRLSTLIANKNFNHSVKRLAFSKFKKNKRVVKYFIKEAKILNEDIRDCSDSYLAIESSCELYEGIESLETLRFWKEGTGLWQVPNLRKVKAIMSNFENIIKSKENLKGLRVEELVIFDQTHAVTHSNLDEIIQILNNLNLEEKTIITINNNYFYNEIFKKRALLDPRLLHSFTSMR